MFDRSAIGQRRLLSTCRDIWQGGATERRRLRRLFTLYYCTIVAVSATSDKRYACSTPAVIWQTTAANNMSQTRQEARAYRAAIESAAVFCGRIGVDSTCCLVVQCSVVYCCATCAICVSSCITEKTWDSVVETANVTDRAHGRVISRDDV